MGTVKIRAAGKNYEDWIEMARNRHASLIYWGTKFKPLGYFKSTVLVRTFYVSVLNGKWRNVAINKKIFGS